MISGVFDFKKKGTAIPVTVPSERITVRINFLAIYCLEK